MTNNQRRLKKLSIVGLILSVLIVIVWFMIKPEEQLCFNGIKDAGEQDVDCGGFCEKKCPLPPKPPQVQDIKVEWVKYIKDGENNYDLVAKLSNDNEQWGVSAVNYKFTVYNDRREAIGEKNGQTYIMPKGFLKDNLSNYVIEDNFQASEDIKKIDFGLSDFNWREIGDPRDLPSLGRDIIIITDKDYGFVKQGKEFYYAYGVTKNASIYSFKYVDINVVLYDINGEPIAAGKTDQWTMGAGSGWEFKIFWKNQFSGEVYYADYAAQTNVFSSGNFMKDYGTEREYTIPK